MKSRDLFSWKIILDDLEKICSEIPCDNFIVTTLNLYKILKIFTGLEVGSYTLYSCIYTIYTKTLYTIWHANK